MLLKYLFLATLAFSFVFAQYPEPDPRLYETIFMAR